MIVRRTAYLHPLMRWRWDAAGMFGYRGTERGATAAARRAIKKMRPA